MAGNEFNMETTDTARAMSSLDAAGSQLTQGWSAAQAEIGGLDGQLGKGPLGTAFMASYRPQATALSQSAEKITPVPAQLAAAGQQSVSEYEKTHGRARDAFSALQ
ncbi:hypothetical protein [Amycolatopsis sp. H20-H5]|uniref:hypothetical protein n=1 Tax=Amycolatopsis sp. H20-H5 TaxID=3046309 RepID=UPI002DB5940A|nr:hypothetical protein [Amycolatopsis sp. H20-H5]MEC3982640.1 hypothetical protein [Amycolatopsis sp. H20-H5]